jgi:hypothetical protein
MYIVYCKCPYTTAFSEFVLETLFPTNHKVVVCIAAEECDNAEGYTSGDFEEVVVSIDPLKGSVLTLCHELVHVGQLAQSRKLCEVEAYAEEFNIYSRYTTPELENKIKTYLQNAKN